MLAFNWVAAGFTAILNVLFLIGCTICYDDFTVAERAGLAAHTTDIIEDLFGLLGWPLKELPAFSAEPCPLGARFGLSQAHRGSIEVGNKPSRVEDLCSLIDEICAADCVDGKTLERIRGRLLFARSLCYGRFGGLALRVLNLSCAAAAAAPNRAVPHAQRAELRRALCLLRPAVTAAPARLVRVCLHKPVLIFTDGAYEDDVHMTIGGVLLDPGRRVMEFFGAALTGPGAAALRQRSGNPIAVIELVAILISLAVWSRHLEGQPCIGFVDNEAAKHGLARGLSNVLDIAGVLETILNIEIEGRLLMYFERVPTASNIADAPSRG